MCRNKLFGVDRKRKVCSFCYFYFQLEHYQYANAKKNPYCMYMYIDSYRRAIILLDSIVKHIITENDSCINYFLHFIRRIEIKNQIAFAFMSMSQHPSLIAHRTCNVCISSLLNVKVNSIELSANNHTRTQIFPRYL